jgi:hypothetical protein
VQAHIHPSPFRFTYGLVSSHGSTLPGSVSRCSLSSKPPSAQSPFARLRRYLFRRDVSASRPRALPLLLRSYGLMRQTLILPPPRLPTRLVGLCRLSPVPAGCWPFPTLSPYVFPWMLGPIPRRLPWCLRPFLPRGLRPSPRFDRVGFSATYPYNDFRTAIFLGAADIPLCSGLQVCSPPRSLRPIRPSSYGRHGFYFRASYSSFPPHTSDMLTARIGQLAVGDLHPIRLTVLSATPKTLNCYNPFFNRIENEKKDLDGKFRGWEVSGTLFSI